MGGNPDLITAIMDRSLLLTILYLRSTVTVASCLAVELLQGPLIFFENSKRICACDSVTLWEEQNTPLAGQGRQNKL